MNRILYSNARSKNLEELDKTKQGCWMYIAAPKESEIPDLAAEHNLDEDLLRDALDLYEAPRVEREDDDIYVFTRYYHPNNGVINATEPLLIIYRPSQLVTVLRTDSSILTPYTDGKRPVTTTQKTKTLLLILEAVNASYRGYLNSVTKKIFSARSQMRNRNISNEVLLGFVEIEDDLNEFLSALQPQAGMLRTLLGGKYIRLYEEDKDLIEDLSLGTTELIDLVKSRLKTIVTIRESFDALAASDLNKTFRRLTSISIFFMVPTVISGIYGMNTTLPFAEQVWGFWFIMAMIVVFLFVTVMIFRRKRWI